MLHCLRGYGRTWMKSYSVQILGLGEVRWTGSGKMWSEETMVLHSGGKARGVSIMMDAEGKL